MKAVLHLFHAMIFGLVLSSAPHCFGYKRDCSDKRDAE